MRPHHYVAHIALLTTFVVGTVAVGFYIFDSPDQRDALKSVLVEQQLRHTHVPAGITNASGSGCRVCAELGVMYSEKAGVQHLTGCYVSLNRRERIEPDANSSVSLGESFAAWVKSLIPSHTKTHVRENMEEDVIMSYAVWD